MFEWLFGNKQSAHNRLKYPELKESDFEEVIEYKSALMHQSLSVLRNKNSYILVLPINAQVFEITLANARTLNTDVVEASYFRGCCAECAKRRGRWFSLTGRDKRFPLLDINYDCSCTGIDYDPVIPGVSVPDYDPSNEKKYIIHFNRPMTDDRTQKELKTYNKTIEDFKTEFLRCTNSNNPEIDFRIKVCTLTK